MGVVGVVTHDGPDVGGSNVEIHHYCSDWPWVAASVLINAYRVFPAAKVAGIALTTHAHLVLRLKKE